MESKRMTPEQEVEKIVKDIELCKVELEVMQELAKAVEDSVSKLATLCLKHGCEYYIERPREFRYQSLCEPKETIRMTPCNVSIEKTERVR